MALLAVFAIAACSSGGSESSDVVGSADAITAAADDIADTFDPDVEGEPVRDDGVLLLIGPMPEPARSVELQLVRYFDIDTGEPFTLEITAEMRSDDTTADGTTAPNAIVTAVTQP